MRDSPSKVERLKKRIAQLEAQLARSTSNDGVKCNLIGIFSFYEGRHYLTGVMVTAEDFDNTQRFSNGVVQTYVTLLTRRERDYLTAENWIRANYPIHYPEFAKFDPLYGFEKEGDDE